MDINPSMKPKKMTHNPDELINHLSSGIKIPLATEDQKIAIAFASQQKDVTKGKQIFFNTLSVIGVHECLQAFGFESYLESGDCWNKAKMTILNVADLLVQDFGRIECFSILPEKTSIEIEPDLLEKRRGCALVKFSESFDEMEIFGFKSFDGKDKVKSELEKSNFTLQISEFDPFETIFNYLELCPPSPICQGLEWKTFEELGRKKLLFAGPSNQRKRLPLKGKVINLESCQIILGAAVETLNNQRKSILFEIYNLLRETKLPKKLAITVMSDQEVVGDLKQLDIGDNYRFEMKFKNLTIGTIFTLIFSLNDVQVANRFIV